MDDRRQNMNDPEEATRLFLQNWQVGIWTALPGMVTAVDFTKMTCEVQPTIQGQVLDETGASLFVNLPKLVDVPICFPSAGGFLLTLPLKANDEVLIVFSSRCIDSWWQSGGIQKPAEFRLHDLSDGFAIPGPRSVPNVPGGAISSVAAQLRNDAGTASVSIGADGSITLLSATGVTVDGNLVVTGTIGGAGGIGLTTHHHTGVTTGSGTSGGPVP